MLYICIKQNEAIMLFTDQIEKLRVKQNNVRTQKEFDKIQSRILKLAKKYNENNYFDMYLIINNEVYGLQVRENRTL